jgi:methyl-accepting chemotaxis protein
MRFGLKMFFILIGFSIVLCVMLVASLYWFVIIRAEKDIQMHLKMYALSVSKTMASLIDGDRHQTIRTRADESSDAYREIKATLKRFRDNNRTDDLLYVKYAYTKIRTSSPDTMIHVVDAEEDDGSWVQIDSASGDTVYNFIPVGQREPLKWQKEFQTSTVSDIYDDDWGKWITGGSPILNSQGDIVGYAYVDLDGYRLVNKLDTLKRRIVIVSVLTIIVLFVISMILSFVLSSYVNRPIRILHEGIRQVQEGHFGQKIDIPTHDEFQDLSEAFNSMTDRMRAMARQLSDSSHKIAESSSIVLSISKEQAATSSQQSVSVTETTATMEELTSTSRYIAENSESVVTIANQTHDISKTAADLSRTAREKMDEIRQKSDEDIAGISELNKKMQKINDVMGIINNITEQTKLISFNAALEATSAGEAGRRFAIVASEIRRLAETVAESTEEIKTTVSEVRSAMDNIVKNTKEGGQLIREGVDQVEKINDVLENILKAAQNTADSAKQISMSTQQQLTASEQVVTTLREISEGSKQLVKSGNQASSLSADLTTLSEELKKSLEQFNMDGLMDAS